MATDSFEGIILTVDDCKKNGNHQKLLEQASANCLDESRTKYLSDVCGECGMHVEVDVDGGVSARLVK